MTVRSKLRRLSERLVEKSLGVKVYPSAPFGLDPYAAVRRLRPWSPSDVIFDVGANDGRTVVRLQEQFPSPRIFSFEPVSATYQALLARSAPFPNVRCFQLALGARSGQQTINLHEIAAMNSFSAEWAEFSGTETVTVSTVDEVMARESVEFIHFLKIDTEGYELEVLRGAHQALAESRVAIIQLEVGIDRRVSPHTPLPDVIAHFASFGYVLHGIFNQCRSNRRLSPPQSWNGSGAGYRPSAMQYCDAVFVAAEIADGPPRA